LETFGQSIWLDYIRRDLITSGKLLQLIENDSLRGMTSNPAIFQKAITDSVIYDADISKLASQKKDTNIIYETISQQDVQNAADVFRPLYDETKGDDGYVSLEVNPHLANDTDGTIEEARRLWSLLDRPNVLIKVPATVEGLPAIRQLIMEGINVNVTLIFGLPRYREVAEVYIEGLEARIKQGEPIDNIASVASFFISRIDKVVDPMIEKIINYDNRKKKIAEEALGEVAISSAKLAYQIYKEVFGSARFKTLEEKGARAQRLLWASTSNKNPMYSNVKYVEALIAAKTVNTITPKTLDAYRDHGNPKLIFEKNVRKAKRILTNLPELGIDIDEVTQQLEEDGIRKFNKPFDKLMAALAIKSGNTPPNEQMEKDLNSKILKITMKIKEHYPELSKYLEEMPITIPSENDAETTLDQLKTYYESLKSLLQKYKVDFPSTEE
jgi:transaldolase